VSTRDDIDDALRLEKLHLSFGTLSHTRDKDIEKYPRHGMPGSIAQKRELEEKQRCEIAFLAKRS